MANQTNLHKKMDKMLHKLASLEENDRGLAKQTGYLAQLVVLAKQDSQAMVRDLGHLLLEVKKSSERTEQRVAETLSETRRH